MSRTTRPVNCERCHLGVAEQSGFTERLVASYSIWQKIQTVSHLNLVTKCVWFPGQISFYLPIYMTLSEDISTPRDIGWRIAFAHDIEEVEDFTHVFLILGDKQRVIGTFYFDIDVLHAQ